MEIERDKVTKHCEIHGDLVGESQIMIEIRPKSALGYYLRCRQCRNSTERLKHGICRKHGKLEDKDREPNGECSICRRVGANRRREEKKDELNARLREDRKKNPEKWKVIYKKCRESNEKAEDPLGFRMDVTRQILKTYNLTMDEYVGMFVKQEFKCRFCGQPETRRGKKFGKIARLCIDHCHKTGKVRGLVCAKCNLILSFAGDRSDILQNASDYLKESEA